MRIRLNQEYRNKIANRMRVHLEQEDTQEKESFYQILVELLEREEKLLDLAREEEEENK